ncbi:cation:proton antiporter [Aeromonas hydrophila]|uniref:cation:proton antiporter domain-containing protein n=1 Tax=Aeromonas hydrophila TaxID=644 RepID=UPI0022AFC830|nr:cation:proton antiporter [Aeromonas hydrophila]ELB2792511.1 cation:proton antiporter [Aeromonas hydrophila]MCZ4333297.1 cation:proton antiporter [Aeromonas hydrophila]
MDASLIYQNLAVIAAFLLVYSLIAGRFESRLVNGPLLFLLMGWLLGPGGIELLSLSIDSDGIKLLAELTLVIVLFSDAANTNWQVLLANRALPIRLLLIGLPLTLAAGALFGHWLFPDLPLLEMAILSTILAPTDAALGKAVVSNPAVPAPIREGLNQESGLNDGICVPVLLLLLALIAPTEQHSGTGLKPELKLFIGWFGPRGLASIVFAVMVLQHEPTLLGQRPIIATVLCTIILSVILHGLTANPWVARFKPH